MAEGRLDGFWEIGLAAWDVAAGILLVREAGGLVTDFSGWPSPIAHGNFVAGGPAMHAWLLDAVDRVGRRVMSALGQRSEALQGRPRREVMTPSFAAWLQLVEAGRQPGTQKIPFYKEAIRLDSGLSVAWRGLAVEYFGARVFDSARIALNEALRRPERTTPSDWLALKYLDAILRNDLHEALAGVEEQVRRYNTGHNNLGFVLERLGRQEEAVEPLCAGASGPYPGDFSVYNCAEALAKVGRLDEAFEMAGRLTHPYYIPRTLAQLSLVREQWDRADSIALASLEGPDRTGRQVTAAGIRAAVYAVRGRIAIAIDTLDSAEASWRASGGHPSWSYDGAALLLQIAAGRQVGVPAGDCARDGSAETLVLCGFHAALAGDTALARRQLIALSSHVPEEIQRLGCGPKLVEAAIAAVAGRWDTVAPLLGRAVSWAWPERGNVDGGNVVRWLVAEAYDRTGRLDSAAAVYELLASPVQVLRAQDYWHPQQGLVAYSFAHFRLGRLYVQLGNDERAKSHYATFLQTFTDPDPEYGWMVTEARAKLEELARGQ